MGAARTAVHKGCSRLWAVTCASAGWWLLKRTLVCMRCICGCASAPSRLHASACRRRRGAGREAAVRRTARPSVCTANALPNNRPPPGFLRTCSWPFLQCLSFVPTPQSGSGPLPPAGCTHVRPQQRPSLPAAPSRRPVASRGAPHCASEADGMAAAKELCRPGAGLATWPEVRASGCNLHACPSRKNLRGTPANAGSPPGTDSRTHAGGP